MPCTTRQMVPASGVPVGQRQRDQFAVRPGQHAHELAGARADLAIIGALTMNSTMPPASSILSMIVCGVAPFRCIRAPASTMLAICRPQVDVADDLARRSLAVAGGADGRWNRRAASPPE